jgi:hypothetical protein
MSCLALPLDGGLTLHGKRLFGDNKTLRGLLVGSAGTALIMALQAKALHKIPATKALEYTDYAFIPAWRLGIVLGLTRMLSELPNSFLKRQMNIRAGNLGTGVWLPIFYLLDLLDYLPGCWIVVARLVRVTERRVIMSIALALVVHQASNCIGYLLGMKRAIH